MTKPILTIFYQFDPWNSTIGGIQTLISSFIKYAPSDFELRLVGISSDPTTPIGRWQTVQLEGKEFQFMPLMYIENDDVRGLIPTTLRYTAALLGKRFASDFMHFHRIEPTLATLHWKGDKTLFIHNDIRQQVLSKDSKSAFLWSHFPRLYLAIEGFLVRQFNQILSCNSNSAQLYQQSYPSIANRVDYFKNNVDTEIFYPLTLAERNRSRKDFAQKLGLAEDTRFILFAGRLHPQKDPLLLIRAFAKLNELNVHLLIAGEGELADLISAEINQLNLSKQVTMLGAVKQRDLADLHRLASVFVLTSAFEGLPLVALEALACGTPLVTTQAGDTPNLLTENSGLVCDQRTPDAIANVMRSVLNNPDRYPPEACQQAAAPYSARHVIQDVYRSMLKRWNC